jgi:hypothetical protein
MKWAELAKLSAVARGRIVEWLILSNEAKLARKACVRTAKNFAAS